MTSHDTLYGPCECGANHNGDAWLVDWFAQHPEKPALTYVAQVVASEQVNHPTHYNSHPSGVEAIVICRHENFNIGNAFKYLFRAGRKTPNKLEDLRKARWYLDDEIRRLENENTGRD